MKIYQIEITNICNNKCSYCPRDKMKRAVGIMDFKVLDAILENIDSNILRLHHFGESLIDVDLEKKIRYIKKKKPKIFLLLNTNGTLLNNKRTKTLFKAGLDKIILSYHNEKSVTYIETIDKQYRNKIEIIKVSNKKEDLSKFKKMGYQTNVKRLRDLGQVKQKEILKGNPVDRCSFLKNNEVIILWNGDIVPCCECYDNDFILGNILRDTIITNKVFKMCSTCLGYGNDEEETER